MRPPAARWPASDLPVELGEVEAPVAVPVPDEEPDSLVEEPDALLLELPPVDVDDTFELSVLDTGL